MLPMQENSTPLEEGVLPHFGKGTGAKIGGVDGAFLSTACCGIFARIYTIVEEYIKHLGM
ncbi:MAG: hypothetical protein DWC07_06730 [Candidatus Poseidoniales archaeon]|nr:MAG: hypothetical protein DWC07_06730 [Candidatus Poseidoniales archaeon]